MATPYTPKQPPQGENVTVQDLMQWMVGELNAIREAFIRSEEYAELDVLHAAPAKIRNGMEIEADGTDFNPGSGAGKYVRRAGAWVYIG
jgi:hypothetical protein